MKEKGTEEEKRKATCKMYSCLETSDWRNRTQGAGNEGMEKENFDCGES